MVPSKLPPTVEKGDEEGTEDELDDAAEDEEGGLVGPAAPIEEGARLGSAAEEEWYAGSGVERGSATESGPPSGSLRDDSRNKTRSYFDLSPSARLTHPHVALYATVTMLVANDAGDL